MLTAVVMQVPEIIVMLATGKAGQSAQWKGQSYCAWRCQFWHPYPRWIL
jgi:hypothetical protein